MHDTFNQPHDSASQDRLRAMGWDAHFQRHAEHAGGTGTPARVTSVNKDLFHINRGDQEQQATVSGRLRHLARSPDHAEPYPVTGDWVLVRDSVIVRVLPRRNALSRGAAGARGKADAAATREQVIAANLDTVFIVCGLDRDFNIRRIERYLTLVYNCGQHPAVVLTKADLHPEPGSCADEAEAVAFGVPVHLVSAHEAAGVLELEQYLGPGRTACMVGSSGAGKSTLLNRLFGRPVQATGAVSHNVGKGRHTTTGRDMVLMPQGGMLIDNPGIREIAFFEDDGGMQNAFADIERLARACRFADCTHRDTPGCRVLEAAASGELPRERLESYYKVRRELDYLGERQAKSADRVEKERWRDVAKRIKAINKSKRKR